MRVSDVTTTIFSVVYATYLAPLPYREPDKLVTVWTRGDGDRMKVAPSTADPAAGIRNPAEAVQAIVSAYKSLGKTAGEQIEDMVDGSRDGKKK